MDQETDVKEVLSSLRLTFQKTAAELMGAMFGVKARVRKPWTVGKTIIGAFDYICSLTSLNQRYKTHTIIAASMTALETIIHKDVPIEYAKDAFGEFANCYNAMLMDEPLFIQHFGYTQQNPPEDATVLACFPVAWGIHGPVHVGTESVFIRFSAEEIKFGDEIIESLNWQ